MNEKREIYKNIKMIGIDLDGTALYDHDYLTDNTITTLENAMKKGFKVVVATGRSFDSIPQVLHDVKGLEYVATSNGAIVTNIRTGETIFKNLIDPDVVLNAVSILEEKGIEIEAFSRGKAYCCIVDYEKIRDGKSPTRTTDYVLRTRTPVEDIYEFTKTHASEIENINAFFYDHISKKRVRDVIATIDDVNVTSSMPYNFELGGETTSKATALDFLLQKFGLIRDNLITFGDGPNDLSMINSAAIGVAMGNACTEVKESADEICLPNFEDGVAEFLKKNILLS